MSSSGPRYAGSAVNDTSIGTVSWSDLSNAQGSSAWASTYAICYVDKNTSNYIKFTNYGFSIPVDATINGIVVELNGFVTGGTASTISARLVKNNVISGDDKSSGTWAASPLGSSTDLWGLSWTPADINSSNFGFVISGSSAQNGTDIKISGARITVYYTENVVNSYSAIGSGTLRLSGVSTTKLSFKNFPTGSLSLGSTSLFKIPNRSYASNGYFRLQGVSNTFYYSSSFTGYANGNLRLSGTSLFKVPKRVASSSGLISLYGASGTNVGFIDNNYGVKFYSAPILVFGLTISDYDYVSSGQLRLSGDSLDNSNAKHNYTSSGQLRLSGVSAITFKCNYIPTGSLLVSGHAPLNVELHYILNNSGLNLLNTSTVHSGSVSSSGQLRLSGDSLETCKSQYNYISSGQLILSGDSLEYYKSQHISSGQLRLSGDSLEYYKVKYNYVSSGQLRLSGDSLETCKSQYSYIISSGQLILSGDSLEYYKVKYNYVSSGQLRLLGSPLLKVSYIYPVNNYDNLLLSSFSSYRMADGYRYIPNSGLIISGDSLSKLNYKFSSFNSSLILSGQNDLIIKSYYNYISSGSLILSGTPIQKYTYSYKELMSGQLLLINTSLSVYKKWYNTQTSGLLILSGTSINNYIKKYIYIGDGLILINGESFTIETNNYEIFPSGLLLLQNSSLQKHSINLDYYLNSYNLVLSGRSKNKKREVLNNYFYVENEFDENEVVLVSTKKQNQILKWKIKDNAVKSNFTGD